MKKTLFTIGILFSSLAAFAEPMIVEQDFASLFNRFRYSQPAQVPWAGSYFAYGTNGIGMGVINGYGYKDRGDQSASAFYDQMYNGGQSKAHSYEIKNHSCDNLDPSLKAGCEAWWGHCNGWAAAAIKETEPVKTVQLRNHNLEVGHQKAMLTELWLTSNSSFLGNTQKHRETGSWIYDTNDPDYKSFWDVTPRQALFAFMNQVGVMKTGVVIDRFTGDQVWNQPIVGYRILPIRSQDLGSQVFNGKEFYFAQIRMKIFWANDNVHPGHISSGFNIDKTSDSDSADALAGDYAQRTLRFKLFFDAPVVMDATGTQVQSAGRVVGDGLWAAQENPGNTGALDQSHPDFIWLPQTAYIDFSRGYGNPYIGINQIREVAQASRGEAVPVTPPPPQPPVQPPTQPVTPTVPTGAMTKFEIEVERTNVYDGDNALIAERLIARIFSRANLGLDVNEKDIQFSGTHIIFKVYSADTITKDAIRQALEDAEAKTIRIDPLP